MSFAPGLLCACSQDEVIVPADAAVVVHPAELDFGDVDVDTPAHLRLHLRNPGRIPAVVRLDATPPFRVSPLQVEIPASARSDVDVTLVAAAPGPQHGELRVQSRLTAASVALAGTAHAPALEVEGVLDFDMVRVRSWARAPLHVRSITDEPMVVQMVLRDDEHAFIVDTADLALDAGQELALDASFAPPGRGAFEGLLELRACPDCPPHTVSLRGTGAQAQLTASGPSVDFGAVTPGRSLTREVELTNTGDLPLRLVVSTGEAFAVTPSDLGLAPGRSATLEVVFAPAALRRYQDALVIAGGPDPVHLEVPLGGSGGGPDLAAEPPALDFGLQPLGVAAVRHAHLVDAGAGGLHVTAARFEGKGARAYSLEGVVDPPFAVDAQPVAITVRFRPSGEGDHSADLVLATDDPDQPELRVPLMGASLAGPPCNAVIEPPELRFGIVHRGATAERTVRITNRGATRCFLSEVELEPAVGAFQLPDPPGSTFLDPGGSLPILVRFSPSAKAGRTGSLRLRLSDATHPDRAVALSGAGTDLELVATPAPLDFGSLPRGFRGVRSLTVTNRGPSTVRVTDLRITPAPTLPVFELDLPALPVIQPRAAEGLPLIYLPSSSGGDTALLELQVDGELAPLLVELRGRADERLCGAECAPPVASCASALDGQVDTMVDVPGSGWAPAGSPVSCTWTVLRAPAGSRQEPFLLSGCNARLVPDMVGEYLLRLAVTDPQLQTTRCVTRVTAAAPPRGLWVETTWSQADDVDLHLLHPDAGDPRQRASWSGDEDCYYNNPHPDWGVTDEAADDPSLDRDDTTHTGPETLSLEEPVPGLAYSVGLHWFSDTAGLASLDTATNVYCGGSLAATTGATLARPGDLVLVQSVVFDDRGACRVQVQRVTTRR